MRLIKITIILILIISSNFSYANPMILFHINEVQIDSFSWKLELKNIDFFGTTSLDSCFLTSLTDTCYFKSGITTTDSFLVITPKSMIGNLFINRTGDKIGFHSINGYLLDHMSFGNILSGSNISAPDINQSISLREWREDVQRYYYYLDNSPTFGNQNDAINAKGYIEGFIMDSLGNPLPNVEVVYDYFNDYTTYYDISVFTDSTGHFILEDFARLNTLEIRKLNYQTKYLPKQIYPEDTVTINVTLNFVIDALEPSHDVLPTKYKLAQNYPNPFNNSTSFTYSLPKSNFVEIEVYDLTGKLIEKLFSGEQSSGEYKVHWNAESVASGVYIYQIKTNDFITHKKCLLIK